MNAIERMHAIASEIAAEEEIIKAQTITLDAGIELMQNMGADSIVEAIYLAAKRRVIRRWKNK